MVRERTEVVRTLLKLFGGGSSDTIALLDALFITVEVFRRVQGTKQVVHVDEIMTMIVLVGDVVDGVVPSPHHWHHVRVQAVVNIRGPNPRSKED